MNFKNRRKSQYRLIHSFVGAIATNKDNRSNTIHNLYGIKIKKMKSYQIHRFVGLLLVNIFVSA